MSDKIIVNESNESNEPNVSIIVLMNEYKEFVPIFTHNYNTINYPQDKLEWIIIDDSEKSNFDLFPLEENVLYIHMDNPKEYLEKIDFKDKLKIKKSANDSVELNGGGSDGAGEAAEELDEDEEKIKNYFLKTNTLPNGFKRDYGVGLSSYDYILHMDIDAYYDPKVIKRKLRFLKKNRLECIFCDSMLCGFNDKIYKTINELRAFEGTLFHTKEFWKKDGFKWEDIRNEGDSFHYNKGLDRKMDNYYDTIKFIGMHNVNDYQYKEVKVDGKEFDFPEIFELIKVKENLIQFKINKLFKEEYNILGLNSNIIDNFDVEKENINFEKKEKEKVILKKIKGFNKDFNIFIFNYKTEIWNIFKEINFDIILYETDKNFTSMKEILEKNNYIYYENLFINKNYLIK